jgi:hypothetical protein
MEFYGISGVANKLMESYLQNKYQRVIINAHNYSNGHSSKWEKVQHGVPQGSVLGPLLFLIYINDTSKNVLGKSIPFLFVDDTSFIITSQDETTFRKITFVTNRSVFAPQSTNTRPPNHKRTNTTDVVSTLY